MAENPPTYNDPNIPHNIDGIRQASAPRLQRPFGSVACSDLVECKRDDEETRDRMHVILRGSAPGHLGLDPMYHAAEYALCKIECKDGHSTSLKEKRVSLNYNKIIAELQAHLMIITQLYTTHL